MSQHHNVCILKTAGMHASIVAQGNSQYILRNAAGTGADTDVGTGALEDGLLLRLMLGLVLGLVPGLLLKLLMVVLLGLLMGLLLGVLMIVSLGLLLMTVVEMGVLLPLF